VQGSRDELLGGIGGALAAARRADMALALTVPEVRRQGRSCLAIAKAEWVRVYGA